MKWTLRVLCFVIGISFSWQSFAWNSDTHRWIVLKSLSPVAKDWKLETPILVTPFEQFLDKLPQKIPDIKTREDFADWLRINRSVLFDKTIVGRRTTPLALLAFASVKTDDGRDMHLPYDPTEQFWFGKGTKTASQAFRHMEKPPFNLLHPLTTFGFPLGRVGQATQRAQIYFDLAKLAQELQEPYWAYYFLGCGLHYIEDLQNPYHAAQLVLPLPIVGIRAYFSWGRKDKMSLIHVVTHVTSNLHHFFEGYVDHHIRNFSHKSNAWAQNLQVGGSDDSFIQNPKNMRHLAEIIRDFSNKMAYSAVVATLVLTDKNLLQSRPYKIEFDAKGPPEDPALYFSQDETMRKKAEEKIDEIVSKSFAFQGDALRMYVRAFLDQKK